MGGLTDEEKLGIFGEGSGAGGGGEGGEDGELHFVISKSVGRMAGRVSSVRYSDIRGANEWLASIAQ